MMMLDLVEFQHFPYFAVDKGCAIVTDKSVGYPKSHNYIFLDEVCYCSSRGFAERTSSAHLVKYFVATRIHIYPDEGLIGPTKSSP